MATIDPGLLGELRVLLQQSYQNDLSALLHDLERGLQIKSVVRPNTGKRIVEVTGLTKTYEVGDHTVEALRGVELTINEGEIVAIMGPSGSGKTTLLNMLGGLDRPSSGTVSVAGLELHTMSDRELSTYRNKVIGFVFQFFYLQPFLSVRRNVAVPLLFARGTGTANGKSAAAEHRADIDGALKAVGLADRAEHLPSQLSGGQAQRAAIARALVNRPRILLADEPTGNLDQRTASEILGLLRELNQELGTTIILVTHDKHVASLADRVLTMRDGRLS